MDGQISLARRFLVGTLSMGTHLLFISKWLKTVLNHIMAAGPIELYRKEVTFTACTLYILHTQVFPLSMPAARSTKSIDWLGRE